MAIRYKGDNPEDIIPSQTEIRVWMADGLRKMAVDGQQRFEATVETWDTAVDFPITPIAKGFEVGTDSEIYSYTNYGTQPHTIRARDGGVLAFQTDYIRKTLPGAVQSRPGGSSGEFVYAKEVRHPGITATDADADIAFAVGERADAYFDELQK